jgi:hypothetical protein
MSTIKLSASRIKLHQRCERAYEHRYVLDLPDTRSPAADLGLAVHAGAEAGWKRYADGYDQDPDLLLERMVEAYRVHWVGLGYMATGRCYEDGLRMVHELIRMWRPLLPVTIRGVEDPVALALEGQTDMGESVEVDFTGYTDLVTTGPDGALTVHDWKTSWLIPTREEMATDPQAALYAMAYMDHDGPIYTRWWFLRHGFSMAVKWEPRVLEETRQWLGNYAVTLAEQTVYPPTANAYCGSCAYSERCPVWDARPDPDPVTSFEAAVNQLARSKAMAKAWKAKAEQLDAAMRQHLDASGELQHDGKRYYMDTTARRSIEPEHVFRLAELLEVDSDLFEPTLSATVGKVEAVLMGLPEEKRKRGKALLEELADVTYTPRVASRKVVTR